MTPMFLPSLVCHLPSSVLVAAWTTTRTWALIDPSEVLTAHAMYSTCAPESTSGLWVWNEAVMGLCVYRLCGLAKWLYPSEEFPNCQIAWASRGCRSGLQCRAGVDSGPIVTAAQILCEGRRAETCPPQRWAAFVLRGPTKGLCETD
jgi:hypothetical protein